MRTPPFLCSLCRVMLYIHGHAHTSTPVNTREGATQTPDTLSVGFIGQISAPLFFFFLPLLIEMKLCRLRHTGRFPHWSIELVQCKVPALHQFCRTSLTFCGFGAATAVSLRLHDLLSCAVGYRKLEQRRLAFEFAVETVFC